MLYTNYTIYGFKINVDNLLPLMNKVYDDQKDDDDEQEMYEQLYSDLCSDPNANLLFKDQIIPHGFMFGINHDHKNTQRKDNQIILGKLLLQRNVNKYEKSIKDIFSLDRNILRNGMDEVDILYEIKFRDLFKVEKDTRGLYTIDNGCRCC